MKEPTQKELAEWILRCAADMQPDLRLYHKKMCSWAIKLANMVYLEKSAQSTQSELLLDAYKKGEISVETFEKEYQTMISCFSQTNTKSGEKLYDK